ncbi:patatin-like phospholipase family protein [Mesorhizobium sp. L-8-3]|uniref:patatin-like phospholipase family protein n=1 Tax=Mesorhizobium sp. L-8-3 TaxID=2744522 RepID=UPI0019272EC0|nr:patatin-like phospholipase family protein [Mesorhizobium sp. L-8-3]BCH27820.1 patatin [Mesorhizobium sp. L-8-3]
MTTETDRKMYGNDLQGRFEGNAERNDFLTASKVEDKVGLCLSGGGYRAMLYHTGAVMRLNELGLLPTLSEVASVSGGSITAALLALAWPSLRFDESGVASNLTDAFVGPVTRFATVSIDLRAILLSLLPGVHAADEIAKAYDRHLFHGATLQDLPDTPRFTFMATNLQTGSGWRFAKDYSADHRVGRIDRPSIPLSQVVAASSAFPPFLSPVRIPLARHGVAPMPGADLHRPPFTVEAVLTDGGVYDNLGLERVWRRCRTILVSNAGGSTPEIGRPSGRWIGQIFRTLRLIHQQAEDSRKRLLFGVHNLKQRKVAFWSIDTPISAYGVPNAVAFADEATGRAATIRTRLNRFSPSEIGLLLQAGYAGADASLRARGIAANLPPADFSRLPIDLPTTRVARGPSLTDPSNAPPAPHARA